MNFSDRYKIVSEIGSGGMGKIVKAQDLNLNKSVAIKLLNKELIGNDSDSIQRFQREAKAAGKLNHDGLVTILDFGVTEQSEPYIVMEYIEGLSLNEFLEQTSHLSDLEIVDLFSQLADAMSHAHRSGVIHRDLKLSNIIVTDKERSSLRVKVVDFGIAKLSFEEEELHKLTRTNAILGSPIYMSPEQAKGNEVDERSDIYSLGCIIFEVLAGHPPFLGDTAIETIRLHQDGEIPSLTQRAFGEDIEPSLAQLVVDCLAKQSSQRPASMEHILNQLSQIKNSLEIEEEAVEPKEKSGQSGFSWIIVSTIAVMVLGIVSFFAWIDNPAPEERERTRYLKVEQSGKHTKLVAASVLKDSDLKWVKLGDPFYEIKLDGSSVSGPGLNYLIGSNVKNISLNECNLEYVAFYNLSKIDSLRSLSLDSLKSGLKVNQLELLAKNKNLAYLFLRGNELSEELFETIAKIPNLESINLMKCTGISARGLQKLSKCKRLRSINFNSSGVKLSFFEALKNCKSLRDLSLSRIGTLTDRELSVLKDLPLSSIRISDNVLYAKGLNLLASSKTLKSIDLSHCWPITHKELEKIKDSRKDIKFIGKPVAPSDKFEFTSIGYSGQSNEKGVYRVIPHALKFKGMPDIDNNDLLALGDKNIAELNLSNTEVDNAGLPHLSNYNLSKLWISGSYITGSGFETISKWNSLSILEANRISNLDYKQIALLGKIPNLTSISVDECGLDDRVFQSLGKIHSLERIFIRRNGIKKCTNLDALASLPNLRLLVLSGNQLDFQDINKLNKTTVKILRIQNTNLNDQNVKHLAKLNGVVELYITENPLTDLGLLELAKIQSLKSIHYRKDSKFTSIGIREFRKVRPDCEFHLPYDKHKPR